MGHPPRHSSRNDGPPTSCHPPPEQAASPPASHAEHLPQWPGPPPPLMLRGQYYADWYQHREWFPAPPAPRTGPPPHGDITREPRHRVQPPSDAHEGPYRYSSSAPLSWTRRVENLPFRMLASSVSRSSPDVFAMVCAKKVPRSRYWCSMSFAVKAFFSTSAFFSAAAPSLEVDEFTSSTTKTLHPLSAKKLRSLTAEELRSFNLTDADEAPDLCGDRPDLLKSFAVHDHTVMCHPNNPWWQGHAVGMECRSFLNRNVTNNHGVGLGQIPVSAWAFHDHNQSKFTWNADSEHVLLTAARNLVTNFFDEGSRDEASSSNFSSRKSTSFYDATRDHTVYESLYAQPNSTAFWVNAYYGDVVSPRGYPYAAFDLLQALHIAFPREASVSATPSPQDDTEVLLQSEATDAGPALFTVLVGGSISPWVEALLHAFFEKRSPPSGKQVRVFTSEYGDSTEKQSVLTTFLDARNLQEELQAHHSPKLDLIMSYSSLEHDGLGRYCDPVNPFGDIAAVKEWANLLKKSTGKILLGIPILCDSEAIKISTRIRKSMMNSTDGGDRTATASSSATTLEQTNAEEEGGAAPPSSYPAFLDNNFHRMYTADSIETRILHPALLEVVEVGTSDVKRRGFRIPHLDVKQTCRVEETKASEKEFSDEMKAKEKNKSEDAKKNVLNFYQTEAVFILRPHQVFRDDASEKRDYINIKQEL
ncbi:unnamed protein product [Amoebophrya sp. A25]|nr:unnamed protein product [Amoebophrya sp. A25]|eukprot:GSA25T00016504001.1